MLTLVLVSVTSTVAPVERAEAYEVGTGAVTIAGGTATQTLPSGLVVTQNATGQTRVNVASTIGSRGYVSSDFTPGLPSSTPAVEYRMDSPDCASTGPCSGLGTITINFSQPVLDPVLNLAGIGGNSLLYAADNVTVIEASQLHVVLNLATGGLSLTDLSGGNLRVAGSSITADNDSTSTRCDTATQGGQIPTAGATAACGSVRVNGVVSSLTFNLSAVYTQTTGSVPPHNDNLTGDNFLIAVTVPQDYGDAPSSYDAGNAARAVLSDVTLGSGVTEDNSTVANGATSPNAGTSATTDGQDSGVSLGPLSSSMSTYSTTVAISGASKAGTVCGWIDLNRNGTFEAGERACATFGGGATSATLTWATLPGLVAGDSYARFRIGYDATATQLPTGPSSAGEVEDYPLMITSGLPVWGCGANADGLLFQYASATSTTTSVFGVDMVTGDSSSLPAIAGRQVNAVGYNVLDDYVYGWDFQQDRIVRIGSNGQAENVGLPAGLPATGNFLAGDVDDAGFYWLALDNGTSVSWYKVDLTTPVPTLVASGTLSNTIGGVAYEFTFDWAFVEGRLYRVMRRDTATPLTSPAVLVSFDTTTLTQMVVKNFGDLDGASSGNYYGALYADGDGFLYASNNTTGTIYRIDVASGSAATATVFAAGPASTNNDGARCADSIIATDYGDAPDTYRTLLGSGGPRHTLGGYDGTTGTASLMIGDAVDREVDGAATVGANGDDVTGADDESAGPYTIAAGGPTAAAINVPVTNNLGIPATLYAWIDANNNGVFDPSEFASTTVAAGASSATIAWTGLPAALVTGSAPYIRLRLTTDVLTDSALTAYDDRATGPAQDGEVEDLRASITQATSSISLTKTPNRTSLVAGQVVTYTFVATNTGREKKVDCTPRVVRGS